MMLNLDTDAQTALNSDTFTFAWLVDLPAANQSSRLRFTDHATPITIGVTDYLSSGALLGLPSMVRDGKVKSHSVTITFSGNSAELLAELTSRNMTGEDVSISLVLFGADGAPLPGMPVTMFAGTFDGWSYRDGSGGDTIAVKITGPWTKPNLTAGRITSDGDQMERYSDTEVYGPVVDRFYAYAHIQQDNLGWGKD